MCWQECGEKGILCTAGGTAKWYLLWKTVSRFLRKLKIDLPCNPVIPLLDIYPKKTRTVIRNVICIPISLKHCL